jgi:hypothetical protein
MATIMFSESLQTVNRVPLTSEELANGQLFQKYVVDDLSKGWVIQSDEPLVLSHRLNKRRKTITLKRKPIRKVEKTTGQQVQRPVRFDQETDTAFKMVGVNLKDINPLGSESGFVTDKPRLSRSRKSEDDESASLHTVSIEEEDILDEDTEDWKNYPPNGKIMALASESGFGPVANPLGGRVGQEFDDDDEENENDDEERVPRSTVEEDDDEDDEAWKSLPPIGQIEALGSQSGFAPAANALAARVRKWGDDEEEEPNVLESRGNEEEEEDFEWKTPADLSEIRALGSESGFAAPLAPIKGSKGRKPQARDANPGILKKVHTHQRIASSDSD